MTSPSNSLPTTLEEWAVSYKTYSTDTLNTQLDLILNFIYTQLNSASNEQKTNVRQRALAFVIKLQQHEAPTDLICAGLLYTLKTEIPTLQDHDQPSGVTDTIKILAQHLLKTDLIDDVAR